MGTETHTGRLLIVDDSQTVLDILEFTLASAGYEVVTATNGVEAVMKAYETMPDLIVMDLEMPRMNGFHACRLLKYDRRTRVIPIIIQTMLDKERDMFWGYSTGADLYSVKWGEPEEILDAVASLLASRALACAVEMRMTMEKVNEECRLDDFPELHMGIGINTGEVIVGNVGSEKRAKYAAIGSQVEPEPRLGTIRSLTERTTEVQLRPGIPEFTNLKMNMVCSADSGLDEAIYAKTMSPSNDGGLCLVQFSHLPTVVRAHFNRIVVDWEEITGPVLSR